MAKKNLAVIRITGPAETRVHMVDREKFIIGRAPEADVILTSTSTSRKHLSVEIKGQEIIIEDLGSANGSFLNGKRLEVGKKYSVPAKTPVALGKDQEAVSFELMEKPIEFDNYKPFLSKFNEELSNSAINKIDVPKVPTQTPQAPAPASVAPPAPVQNQVSSQAQIDAARKEVDKIIQQTNESVERMRKSAQENFDESVAQAKLRCQAMIKEAELQAAQIIEDARQKCEAIKQVQKQEADVILKNLKAELEVENKKEVQRMIQAAEAEIEKKKSQSQKHLDELESQKVALQNQMSPLHTEIRNLQSELSLMKSTREELNREIQDLKTKSNEAKASPAPKVDIPKVAEETANQEVPEVTARFDVEPAPEAIMPKVEVAPVTVITKVEPVTVVVEKKIESSQKQELPRPVKAKSKPERNLQTQVLRWGIPLTMAWALVWYMKDYVGTPQEAPHLREQSVSAEPAPVPDALPQPEQAPVPAPVAPVVQAPPVQPVQSPPPPMPVPVNNVRPMQTVTPSPTPKVVLPTPPVAPAKSVAKKNRASVKKPASVAPAKKQPQKIRLVFSPEPEPKPKREPQYEPSEVPQKKPAPKKPVRRVLQLDFTE